MPWFYDKYLSSDADRNNPYFSLLQADLSSIAPATVITAEINPLRSEGVDYAAKLRGAGIPVQEWTFRGVAHEFFGMGAVVDEAKSTVEMAAAGLKRDLRRTASTSVQRSK